MNFSEVALTFMMILCVITGVIAYQNHTTTAGIKEAGLIGLDLDACRDACPPYQYGKENDNSYHTSCVAQCDGAAKQKLRSLLQR